MNDRLVYTFWGLLDCTTQSINNILFIPTLKLTNTMALNSEKGLNLSQNRVINEKNYK